MSANPAARNATSSPAASGRGSAGILGSLALHCALLAAFFVTWQHRLDIPDVTPPVVPVELVTLSNKTNIRATQRPTPKRHEEKPVTVAPPPPAPSQPKVTPAPPQEKPALPKPREPKTEEVLPEKAAPLPKPAPPKPKERPKPVPVPVTPPESVKEEHQRKQKPAATKPQKEKTKDFDIDNVEKLLNKVAPAEKQVANAKPAERTVHGVGAQSAMTMELADALRNQIAQCWSPPVGSPNAQDLVVDFDLFLNEDGSIAKATSEALSSSNSYTRAAAGAARRAIYECAPYKLPQEKYATWREINPFHFDPRQMMDQ